MSKCGVTVCYNAVPVRSDVIALRVGFVFYIQSIAGRRESRVTKPFIVIGDKTDHGGVVIQGSSASDAAGKQIARVGDKVTCPRRGHGDTTVIVSGDPTCIIDGQPAARHGDKTACGATLIASQSTTTD